MIVVIGKVPPPIGGVTIYVERLIENLKVSGRKVVYIKLTFKNILLSFIIIQNAHIIHLIASHPFVRLYYGLLCKIRRKNIVITYTDNIGEFPNPFYNYINKLSLKLATIPVVLNKTSLQVGLKFNAQTKVASTFIPPEIDNSNLENLKMELEGTVLDYKEIFCTNAFAYCLDKSGMELYGILPLIAIFNKITDKALIICDPSGTYKEYCDNHEIRVSNNIRILSNNSFSFIDVVQLSNCVIRATTTDGDSLSIHEALFLGKDVLCSDCVDRPNECNLYKTGDFDELREKIIQYNKGTSESHLITSENGFTQMLNVYDELLADKK